MIEISNNKLDADKPLTLNYGFRMDNVSSVQNLTSKKFHPFLLYPNPIYHAFEEEVKYYRSDYLTINGQNLNNACQDSDVIVLIGQQYCNVTALSSQQLTCRPPKLQPAAVSETDEEIVDVSGEGSRDSGSHEQYPKVVVIVGGRQRYEIGKLSYALIQGLNGPLSKSAVIGVICATVFLLFIFVLFLIAYRRKSTESNRVLKNMQEQMDILELRVAAECKEGSFFSSFIFL